MASISPYRPNFVFSSFPTRVPNSNPLFHGVRFRGLSHHKPFLRGSLAVARFGFKPEFLPDPDNAEGFVREFFGKAESVLYTIADAAVSASPENVTTAKQTDDWFTGITNYMESVLKVCYVLLIVTYKTSLLILVSLKLENTEKGATSV